MELEDRVHRLELDNAVTKTELTTIKINIADVKCDTVKILDKITNGMSGDIREMKSFVDEYRRELEAQKKTNRELRERVSSLEGESTIKRNLIMAGVALLSGLLGAFFKDFITGGK